MGEIGSVKAESAMCTRIDAVEWLQDVYEVAKSWGLDLMSMISWVSYPDCKHYGPSRMLP